MGQLGIIGDRKRTVWCPLCHRIMTRHFIWQHGCYVFACPTDRISIRTNDPMVGRWKDTDKDGKYIECPNCNSNMRVFTTSVGYIKTKCPKPKCGATTAAYTLTEDKPATDPSAEQAPAKGTDLLQ